MTPLAAAEAAEAARPPPSAGRGSLVRRLLVVVAVAVLLALLLATGWAVHLGSGLAKIERFPVETEQTLRPLRVSGDAVNLLLAGVDDGGGGRVRDALAAPSWPKGRFRSDALMVAHLTPDGTRAQVVALPRDSWVEVAGHGEAKINAAFSYGGPSLMVRAVEDLTGVRVDHVIVVDMAGFVGIADALGGLEVPTAAGRTTTLQGREVLSYVRERKSLPRGDLDRIMRQQNMLRTALSKAATTGVLANPVRLTRLVRTLGEHVAVDDSLDGPRLRRLVLDHRALRPANVDFFTAPVTGFGTRKGQSVVLLDLRATREMFRALAEGRLAR